MTGKAWDPNRKLIEWDGAKWAGYDVPDIVPTAKPDVVAYGVGIESLSDPHSTLYSTYGAYLLNGTRNTSYKPYLSMSGTSMAAPVVAGTVALLWDTAAGSDSRLMNSTTLLQNSQCKLGTSSITVSGLSQIFTITVTFGSVTGSSGAFMMT